MTRSKVKVTSPSKSDIRPFLKAVYSAIDNGSWQLATDSSTRAQYLNFDQAGFLIFAVVSVSCDFELGRKVSCEELTVSPVRG